MQIKHLFYQGDALEVLRKLPDESVQCAITSPPYWSLRDYGTEGQIGLEETPEQYVNRLVDVFREVWRVLRADGIMFLNLGDSYAGSWGNYGAREGRQRGRISERWHRPAYEDPRAGWAGLPPTAKPSPDLKPKDLVGIPWLVAFALRADGWYLRSDIIWNKPNPMPESVTDRPTKAHEYIFLLSKSPKYYYDAEAVKEEASGRSCGNRTYKYDGLKGHETKQGILAVADKEYHARNRRTVWTIATQPFPEAHFATFPQALVEPCILAGTSEKACPKCGAPWERVVEKERTFESGSGRSGNLPNGKHGLGLQGGGATVDIRRGPVVHTTTIGFQPTCTCPDNDGSGACVVLDPFGGSGTVSLVAKRLGRGSIYIDLNPEYLQMALKRMGNQETLFEEHGIEVIQ